MRKSLLLLCLFASACLSDSRSAKDALTKYGFTDIRTEGYAFFGCGDDDSYHTAFTATNVNGLRVSGVVCCGFWKNCTVRF